MSTRNAASEGTAECGYGIAERHLHVDLTAAMRAGDETTVRTIRMVLTSISQAESSGTSAHELSGDEEVAILSTELKRRRESAEAFANAGRDELADAESAEADVILRYLPAPDRR